MKIAFKNFLQTLRRYKAASLLNIAGLTLAFTAFYIIMVQVWWEVGYNRSLPGVERIRLANALDKNFEEKFSAWLGRAPMERAIAASPDVEAWAVCSNGNEGDWIWIRRDDAPDEKVRIKSANISLSALDLFGFRPIDGDLSALARPNTVVVTRSAAKRCGIEVGSAIVVDKEVPTSPLEVVGIFEDFPQNTFLSSSEMLRNLGDQDIDRPGDWMYFYYLKLRDGADPAAFAALWQNYYAEVERERISPGEEEEAPDPVDMRLTPLTEVYFAPDIESYGGIEGTGGSWSTTLTLLGIAVLVVVIAFINFVNFFFVLIPVRLRAVNTFKVFGAPTLSLRFSFVFEAVGLVVISLLLSCYMAYALQGSYLAAHIDVMFAPGQNLPVVALVAVVALILALAASLYPAWYITSFAPAMVVKGRFGGTRAGRRLRLGLIGVQYIIAIGMIAAAACMQRQHAYVMNFDLGFNRNDLLVFDVPSRKVADARDAFYSALKSDPQVKEITCSQSEIISNSTWSWGRTFKGASAVFGVTFADWNFLDVMGIEVYDGRDFLRSDAEQQQGIMITNRSAQRAYGLKVGDTFDNSPEPIVGFYPDTHFVSLYHAVCPHMFFLWGKEWADQYYMSHYYLRLAPGADPAAVKKLIQRSVDALDPLVGHVDVRPFEEEFGALYGHERRTAIIVTAFSLLAVVIALMGVFGVVLFETQYRRREIAVRKVMGATTGEVLRMFNTYYIRTVAVCALIALPVSIWGIQRWSAVFAYRAPLAWWVFALAFAAVAAVTVLTVTVCMWRTANENPSESVKTE